MAVRVLGFVCVALMLCSLTKGVDFTSGEQPLLPILVQKAAAALGRPRARAMLQSGAATASEAPCSWGEKGCRGRFEVFSPDDGVSQLGQRVEMCGGINAKADCLDSLVCSWDPSDEECSVDVFAEVGECIDPGYLMFVRGAECPLLVTEDRCTSLPGCQWNADMCEPDFEALAQALLGEGEFAKAFRQNNECKEASPCAEPCGENAKGECHYTKLADVSQWILPGANTTFCQYFKLGVGCTSAPSDSTCTGECEIGEEGDCDLSDEAAVEFLYQSSQEEKTKWLDAVKSCSAIEDQAGCEAFTFA